MLRTQNDALNSIDCGKSAGVGRVDFQLQGDVRLDMYCRLPTVQVDHLTGHPVRGWAGQVYGQQPDVPGVGEALEGNAFNPGLVDSLIDKTGSGHLGHEPAGADAVDVDVETTPLQGKALGKHVQSSFRAVVGGLVGLGKDASHR